MSVKGFSRHHSLFLNIFLSGTSDNYFVHDAILTQMSGMIRKYEDIYTTKVAHLKELMIQ